MPQVLQQCDEGKTTMLQDLAAPLTVVVGWIGVLAAYTATETTTLSSIKDIGSWAVIVYLVIWWTRRQERLFTMLIEQLREMRRDIQWLVKDLEDKD